MATSNPPTRMSRLGVFTSRHGLPKAGPSSSLSRTVADEEEEDDWYIPYNGPYEEPSEPSQRGPRDSWGDLLNGWLSEEEAANARGALPRDGRSSQAASAPEDRARSRVISTVSRQTHSTGGRTTHLRSHPLPRKPTMSFTMTDQTGGVGESPIPPNRTSHPLPEPPPTPPPSQPPPTAKRGSLASIFTFGRKSMRLSTSAEQLAQSAKRDRANTDATPLPAAIPRPNARVRSRAQTDAAQPTQSVADEYYNSYYSTLLNTPGDESRRRQEEAGPSHPYAYAFPETAVPEPHSAPAAVEKGKGRLLNAPKISFNLLDPRGASKDVPDYLKPSPRNSLLKASISTPNLRHIPKGKQRWWAAETWCDAIMFPRPRFALRFVDPSGSGRIVSPPPSPIMFSSQTPTMSRKPEGSEKSQEKSPKKARSMGNMMASAQSHSTGGHEVEEVPIAESSTRRPPRPKSFAWDDLALPSPVPSLAKVLEEGEQLKAQRKRWQTQASSSFLDKRAGTMSRARSKSIGSAQPRPRTRSREHAFERLAERTLLGNQTRPPTIHVRGPSTSHSRSRSQSNTQTQTQTQTHTQTQTQTQTQTGTWNSRSRSRARSHAHSNSLGNSWRSASNETGGGHSRSQSVGKTAFKLVVTTASSAAALCGLSQPSPSSEKQSPFEEKRPDLQSPDDRPIVLPDQMHSNDYGNVIVISPTSASAALAMISPRTEDVSPTPSALSGSAEGVGIAITLPSDDHSRQQGREPIRIPTHPYAQNFAYNPSRPMVGRAGGGPTQVPSPNAPGQEQQANVHRQPVLVHPYSQPGHPYASLGHHATKDGNPAQYLSVPPRSNSASNKLYAELTPGSVRGFDPDDIRYSPDIVTPTVVVQPKRAAHPYGPPTNRMSELGFGEALMHTMRRTSVDSGLGTSESGGGFDNGIDWERPAVDLSPANDIADVVRIHRSREQGPNEDFRLGERPGVERQTSDGVVSYNNTTASSPPENVNPPAFRRTTSNLTPSRVSSKSVLGNSSGSSPGMVSHDSSPPLSPRPINTNEDLERYRDLFYRPTPRTTVNLDDDTRSPIMSRLPSGSIPFDVSSQSSRSAYSRSGLSDLARQLSEDLEELRRERGSGVSDADSQMWGGRFAGLRGSRPEDMEGPHVVLAHLASATNSSGAENSPLRLPIDTSFVSPATNVPEDIESSRASSILELTSVPDHGDEVVRMGEVEAVSTPPIISSPQRYSTQLSLVGHGESVGRPISSEFGPPPRITSQQSNLLTPLTPNTRSSYMTSNTDTSRMSGLSDFPAPPSNTLIIPSSSLIANINLTVPPSLLREPSQDTFGRHTDDEHVGEAL
ncbi:hypothetical protein EIP86_010890 [Pleurotus ostreatoroseus]|nr:hypothetical protein EIP86_010890 [Pleurotus ostreatoroseus]